MLHTRVSLLMEYILGPCYVPGVLRLHGRVSHCLLSRRVRSGGEVGPVHKECCRVQQCVGEEWTVGQCFRGGRGPRGFGMGVGQQSNSREKK